MPGSPHLHRTHPIHLAALLALLLATLASLLAAPQKALAAPTTLSPGDIAITGYITNGSPDDSFSFVTLAPLGSGTVIYFTDNGWTGSQFRGASATDGDGNENLTRFTASADIPAGQVIRSVDTSPNFVWTTSGSIGTSSGAYLPLALSQSGEQIAAFQSPGTANPLFTSPTGVFQIDNTGTFEDATTSTTGSVLPGLAQAANTALLFNSTATYAAFNLTALSGGTKDQWLAAIGNAANWTFGSLTSLPAGSITVGPPAPTPGVAVSKTALSVTEGGATDSYTFSLTTAPASDVQLSVASASANQAELSRGDGAWAPTIDVTFSAGASASQTILVRAVDDTAVEGAHSETINHTLASSDPSYNGANVATVTANITDNDAAPSAPSIIAQPASQTIAAGQTANLTVVASGTEPLSYQWYQGTTGDTSAPVGTNSASFTTPALSAETSYWVRVSNSAGAVDSATATVTVSSVCAAPFTPIYAIQGSGAAAAITGNVTTQGVVVGDFDGPSPNLGGFYIQDLAGDGDSNTSDGIFVFSNTGNAVSAGDLVRVTGYARERFNQTTINGSNSNAAPVAAANITICSSGNALPAPVAVTFPVASDTALERFEGMRVTLPQRLTILEYYNYDQFGEIVIGYPDDIAELEGRGRFYTPTNIVEPGAGATALAGLYALRRITLDDTLSASNPPTLRHPNGTPFSPSNSFRGGDKLENVVGVLGYDFSLYRIQPTGPAQFTAANPRPAAREDVGGRIQVASFNTLNYFLTPDYPSGATLDNKCGPLQSVECRGWDSDQPTELARQREKLIQAIRGIDADVIGLNELENTSGVEPLADIVAALNAIPGGDTYAYINTGTIGTDAIKVGMIYRPSVVAPIGNFALLTASVDARFVDTRNRPALAQTFIERATGARFTVVANHLKSKGSSCGAGDDDTTVGGPGNCNGTRTQAAQALVDWLATDPTGSGDPDVLIIGDLNSYAMEDPIDAILAGADDTPGTADDWTNLTAQFKGRFASSYVFDGQLGYLDHALGNASLSPQVTGVTEWHINADESDAFDYDTTFKPAEQEALYEANAFRTSDHDPVVIGLSPTVPDAPPALGVIATYDTGLGESGAEIVSVRGDRALVSNALDGSVDIVDVSDLLSPRLVQRMKTPELAGLTSVAIHPTKDLFVAVAGASASRAGRLLVFRLSDGELLTQAAVAPDAASPNGRQPDSVEFSPDGTFAVIAVEAEAVSTSDDGGAGAIAVADFSAFDPASSNTIALSTVELPDIASLPGVSTGRTHGDATGVAITNAPGMIEPEGIGFAADSQTVYVTLQENNAIARLSLATPLPATLSVGDIFGLGQVSFTGDTSTSGGYSPVNPVLAFREPDGVRAVEIGGTRYLVTADEGDTRNSSGGNSVRGGRTLSIFHAATGALVADAADQLSALTNRYGIYPDSRSNRAATEPEMLDIATFGGRVIAAVGMERAGAVAFVDLSIPTAPLAFGLVRTGDNPEGVKLVERNGVLYVLAANEVSGTVSIATVPVTPLDAAITYTEDTPRAFGVGAIDRDGDSLTVSLALSPADAGTLSTTSASGTLAQVVAALRAVTFTPALNYASGATITVTASDGVNPATSGTITLAGSAVNDAPLAANDSYTTAEDATLRVQAPGVLANDSDADGDRLSASLKVRPDHGVIRFNADGSFTFTPARNFNGTTTFQYVVSDGKGGSAAGMVTITVTPVNDAPIALPNVVSMRKNSSVTLNVLANDIDIDGDALTVTAVGKPSRGTATIVNGQVRYTPKSGFVGVDGFTYTISDGKGGTATSITMVLVTK